jgi:hypothetical protein
VNISWTWFWNWKKEKKKEKTMFLDSYNEIIRCIRARVPVINLVLESERFLDQFLPSSLTNAGAQILTESQILNSSNMSYGDPVIVLDSSLLTGVTVFKCLDRIRSLSSGGKPLELEKPALEFAQKCTKTEAGQIQGKAQDWLIVAGMEVLAERVKERCGSAFTLLLLRDTDLKNDKKLFRALLNHCAKEIKVTVAVVTSDPISDLTLRACMPVIKIGHPSVTEISRTILSRLKDVKAILNTPTITISDGKGVREVEVEDAAEICGRALAGLHIHLALNLLTMFIESGLTDTGTGKVLVLDVGGLGNAKADILNKEGYMELIRDLPSESRVGGLVRLKAWVRDRAKGFTGAAKAAKLATPKGVMLVGPPGTAKSLSAKMIAGMFGVPLIRLDMGALFNSLLGSSEKNLRNALAVAEASSPSVLLVDECDKGMAGMAGGQIDSGTSARLMGTLLTWLVSV